MNSINQKWVAVAAIVVVAFGAWWLWGGTDSNTPEKQQSEQKTDTQTPPSQQPTSGTSKPTGGTTSTKGLEVSYTGNGFSPSALTVKKGTSVKFVNRCACGLRLEAVNKRSTDIYATFGVNKTMATSETFTYVFNDKGIAYFHNLNNTKHTGTIVVTD